MDRGYLGNTNRIQLYYKYKFNLGVIVNIQSPLSMPYTAINTTELLDFRICVCSAG